ncbi:MAG: beta-galactosidase trimerization domain-containing protein [Chitinophagaceae bacterium]|nr:beta-galactosidase trimerization domain-containing protein [Chitinophagaceae bacterium]
MKLLISRAEPFLLLVLAALLAGPLRAQERDEYLTAIYDNLHASPMQEKFRQIAPMPFGVVFLPWAGCTEQDMRKHFRMMKELGFTNLKQTMDTPEWPEREILRIALEEGIIPFWYGEGGWEPITKELLLKLGIPANLPMPEIRKHPKMKEYQNKVLWKHWDKWKQTKHSPSFTYKHSADAYLRPTDIRLFRQWIKEKYQSIDNLAKAWNLYEVGITPLPYKSWDDFDKDPLISVTPGTDEIIPSEGREYGRVKDILRFKADMYLKNIAANIKSDFPEQPVRAGGEMGLFLPFAARATDMEGIAEVMKNVGSFYPSIHLAWHYEELDYEVTRPIYMQSSLCTDWFKGGWAATWESTGGPQQFSGGKGWDRKGQDGTAGFTVNSGTITQLLLSYLAGGFKGAGLWSWNARKAGWESGEYALLDRNNEPGERAIRAGNIAKAADRYRDELWKAHKEPYVGVFVNWDNEAIWAAVAGPNRTHFKNYPIMARVGISRALINANIPFEYVTASDIRNGLAQRYKVIYMPAQVSVNEDLFPLLTKYVTEGGRLVLDAPGGWWNEQGKVLNTSKGSGFEQVFGASVADFQYSNNVPFKIGEQLLNGFVLELKPTTASVVERFQNGLASVTENKLGRGQALILAADASFSMKGKNNSFMERWTLKHAMGNWKSPYSCPGAIIYRQAAPGADHYFLLNDDQNKRVAFSSTRYQYKSFTDALTGQKVNPNAIELEAYGGRWIRAEK